MSLTEKQQAQEVQEVQEVQDVKEIQEVQELKSIAEYQEFISEGESFIFFAQTRGIGHRATEEFAKGSFSSGHAADGNASNACAMPIRIGLIITGKDSDAVKGCFWNRTSSFVDGEDIYVVRYKDGISQPELQSGVEVTHSDPDVGKRTIGLSAYFSWTDTTLINEDIGSLYYPGIPETFKSYYRFLDDYVEGWLKSQIEAIKE